MAENLVQSRESPPNETTSFLCLPAEIRNKIYKHIVTGPAGLRNRHRRGQIGILATCHQIRVEASAILHQHISIRARLSCSVVTNKLFYTPIHWPQTVLNAKFNDIPAINRRNTTHFTRYLTITATVLGEYSGPPFFPGSSRTLREAFPNLEETTVVPRKASAPLTVRQSWLHVFHFAVDVLQEVPTVKKLRVVRRVCDVNDEDHDYYRDSFKWEGYADMCGWKPAPTTDGVPFLGKEILSDRQSGRLEIVSLTRRSDEDLEKAGFGAQDRPPFYAWI